MNQSDRQLIGEFAQTASDRVFEQLAERHAGMVFAAALRVTRCPDLAEDIAQMVFAILMRKAGRLIHHPCLAAWLHKTATLEATRVMRKENNYRRKLQRLAESQGSAESSGATDHPATEYLDQAMASLSPDDQQFLMLRYYEGYKVREIATLLGKSEVAARKQSQRAIARLTRILERRGVAISSATLVSLLSTAFIKSMPAGLVASITKGAADASAALSTTSLISNTLQTMTYSKQITITAAAVALIAAIPLGVQSHRLSVTKAKLHQVQAALISNVRAAESTPSTTPTAAESTQSTSKLAQEARASGSSDAELLRGLLTRENRPPHSEISDFIGTERSLSELRGMFESVMSAPLGQHQQAAMTKILFEMGKQDGKLAVELAADSVKASAPRIEALRYAYMGWGTYDPAAAWAYPKTLSPEEKTKHPFKNVIAGAAIGDLEASEVYAFVESHEKELMQRAGKELWQSLTYVYDHKDSQGMPSWVESLQEGGLRDFASSHLIQRWALSEPHAASEWMEANVDISKNTHASQELVRSWAQLNPEEAINWLSSMPQELQTAKHYKGLFDKWMNSDQVGAARWLAQAEPSPFLDDPFEQYVYRIRYTDPQGAMNWATSITDPQQRAKMVEKVAEAWESKDPAGLQRFLASDSANAALK